MYHISGLAAAVDRQVEHTAGSQGPFHLTHDTVSVLHMVDAVLDDDEIERAGLYRKRLTPAAHILRAGIPELPEHFV